MTDSIRYDASQISAWMTAVFEKLGVPSSDAAITTDTLVDSDLMGIDSHGLARVARWNGQTAGGHAFSVAQHSCLVEAILAELDEHQTAADPDGS